MDAVGKFLLEQHKQFLRDRAVSDEVAGERGYRSVTKKSELQALGFGRNQQLVPALVIPSWSVCREIESYQLRPDTPRLDERGRPRKYEMKRGDRMILDVHPRLTLREGDKPPMIADPAFPIFVTEAIPKADAAVSIGLCCVGILGVWNFRGTNKAGGKVALADWENIHLQRRSAYTAFDSDEAQNRQVHAALERLKAFLERRESDVKVIYLPPGPHGEKTGLDDFIARQKAAGKSNEEIRDALLALATPSSAGQHIRSGTTSGR